MKKNYLAPNVSRAEVEKPCYRENGKEKPCMEATPLFIYFCSSSSLPFCHWHVKM